MDTQKQFDSSVKTRSIDITSDGFITHSQLWLEVKDVMNKDVVTVSLDETLVSVANIMSENNISCVVVMDNDSVMGIVTEKDFLKRISNKFCDNIKVAEIMSSPVESIPPDFSVFDASRIMTDKQIKRLPILIEKQLVGIVTQTDLTRALMSYGMWRDVTEITSGEMAGIQIEATVAEAAEIMSTNNISCIVAMKADEAVGVLTERDILKRVIAAQKDPLETMIKEVMSSPLMSIPPDYSVFSACRNIEKLHIRRLVVLDEKRLCGIVTQTDIFRAIKAKLQEEENKTLQLLENSENNIYTLDLDGKITYVNPAFIKLLEISESKELVGQPFLPERFWFNPEDRSRFLSELKEERVELEELTLKTAKGKKIYVTLFSTFAKNVQGEIKGSQGILYDVTKRKEAEESAAIAYKKLENTNKKMREIQFQMVQSEKMASIGQLAAGVAHEMNTPVGFVTSNFQTLGNYVKKMKDMLVMYKDIAGNIQNLEKVALIEKTNIINEACEDMQIDFILEDIQGLFDDSKEGLERITNIIQNLRDFSRVDQAEDFAEYNLNDGIESTLMVANNEIKYDANVRTEFSEVPLILCNSGQINQVFLNIFVNAAQAVKSLERDKKGTITIKTYSTDGHVVCEICDDGPGIPPDKLSKVFDPFFTTKPVGKGTGLGLSVSYDLIVNKHKGEFVVDSTVGKGTTFTIRLPIKSEQQNNRKDITSNGN